MEKYNKLDLASMEILKILSDYSFKEVQEILKKTELNVSSTFFVILMKQVLKN